MSYNFMNEITPTANETIAASDMESYTPSDSRVLGSVFSPLAPIFHSRRGNDVNILAQQEQRHADIATSTTDMDNELLMNLPLNSSEMIFDDVDQSSVNNNFVGSTRTDSVASSSIWGDVPATSSAETRNGEMMSTFDFLLKSLSSANNYVSMLSREQLSVLRSIRPSVLYEFLHEVAKVRTDKRTRRAAPNECAFCKNNGENEECYSSHALKDWRGRVLCPVLRAFRCPRCGATGDRAHTIKYCPDNGDNGLERSGSFAGRRRMSSSTSLLFGGGAQQAPAPPMPSPAPGSVLINPPPGLWNTFGSN